MLIALAGAALLILGACRQDMHDQPRYKPLAQSDFYADQRSARAPVDGTVARGHLNDDTYFHTGKVNGQPGEVFPYPVTATMLARGQERFNIYCSPCHSRIGDGNGMIVQRGLKHPPSYQEERLRKSPPGYFFDVMTNGYGQMQDYSMQLQPADRWAIVAYIRALQLSQGAKLEDLTPEERAQLPAAPMADSTKAAAKPAKAAETNTTKGEAR